MSKIEKEIKILDIEIEQLKRKLDILGANLKNDMCMTYHQFMLDFMIV